MTSQPQFILRRFNPRRVARGVEGAEVEIIDENGSDLLWMSPKDVENNIKLYGPHPGLLAAQAAYERGIEICEH